MTVALGIDTGGTYTDQVEVQMTRVDHSVPSAADWGQQVYLETELTFTAAGRPRLAQR